MFSTNNFVDRTQNHAIVVDGKRYPGATKILRGAFYDSYKPPVKYRRRGRSASSKSRGDVIHRQLFHAFRCKDSCQCKQRFGVRTPKRTQNNHQAVLLKALLRKHSLEFVDGEVCVAWPEMNVATVVDGVARHRLTGRLYLLEYKTGYPKESRHRAASQFGLMDKARMDGCTTLSNCSLNQHHLQLWFGVEAMRRTYPKLQVEDGLLLYFDKEGVDVEWHMAWRVKHRPCEELEAQLAKNRK